HYVDVEDPDGCPRYTARILKNVKIGPSPDWMTRRLEAAGIRSINNVVDITNYVMLECGQPLHAFDQTLLKEGRIVVRRARPNEKMATLDSIDRPLTETSLVICDAERPVALAGIMGGAGSEINDQTATVLLESACFKPAGIRATSRRIGLSTESSYRFERGVDISSVEWAGRRAASLMQQYAGAEPAQGVVDVYPAPQAPRLVPCRYAAVNSVLGLSVDGDLIKKILSSLELGIESSDGQSCTVQVPTFRNDLDREIDLVEEFARVYGLDKIQTPSPRADIVPEADDTPTQALQRCRDNLVGLGLAEILNYSFVSENLLNVFDPDDKAQRVYLPNPISADHSILRSSLAPQMVETLGRNAARQLREASFFEIGRVFTRDAQGKAQEETHLAIGLMGPVGRTGIDSHKAVQEEEMFLWIKGLGESLFRSLRIGGARVEPVAVPWMETGTAVSWIINGQPAGIMGLVKSAVRKEWRLTEPVAVLELKTDLLLNQVFKGRSYAPVAAFPSISRDMALVVNTSVRHEDIENVVKKYASKDLESIRLFDIFAGEGIGAGRKSMAYSLTYRSSARTLTDEDANRYHEDVKNALKKELDVEVREG
ncbi:MAG: phenylalanine--tRNA ligase subunit beta, partial [Lentisphaerota bacterium]